MAPINSILTQGSLQSVDQPFLTQDEAGAGIARAAQGLGGAMSQGVQDIEQIATMRKHLTTQKWVGESIEQEKNYINKWMADPQNNSKESFPDDLQVLYKDRSSQYDQSAPNSIAKQQFRQEFGSFMSSRYESALQTSATNKVTNLTLSVGKQIDDAMDGYRAARDVPNVDSNKELLDSIDSIKSRINQTFGKIAPATAQQLTDKLMVDSVYASMNTNPHLAMKILDSSGVEGRTHHILEDEINRAILAKNSADVVTFEEKRRNWIAMVEEGKKQDKIPLGQYQLYYPDKQANEQKLRDDNIIDIHVKANNFMSGINSLNAQEQTRAVNDFTKKIGDDPNTAMVDQEVARIIHQRVFGDSGTLALMKKDPVGYLAMNNPVVKRLADIFTKAPDGPDKQNTMLQMLDTITKYQGPAPTDTDPVDAKTYMGVPRNQVRIMSTQEAEQAADQVNQGSPKDALKTIASVLDRYPDKYKPVAFSDMTKLSDGKRIRGEYWVANLNQNASWVDDYLGVLQNAEAVKKSASDRVGDFERAINNNNSWLTFANPAASDNFQHEGIVEDFKNGILLYSMGLAQRSGLSPEKSVKLATSRVLNEQLGFGSVNGKTVLLPRDPGGGKPMRTDDDINDMSRRLNSAILYLDPHWIKRSDEYGRDIFPVLNVAGNEDTKLHGLQSAIQQNGVFHTSSDGKTVNLYYDDGVNQPFELRDKKNRAFTIDLDKLPNFTSIFASGHDFFGGRPNTSDVPLYDSVMHGGTNWPIAAPFWKFESRK